MFDNLKEKLGSFRKDAEEAAEENVEAVEDAELDDEDDIDADGAELDDADDADAPSDEVPAETEGRATEPSGADSAAADPSPSDSEGTAVLEEEFEPRETAETALEENAENLGEKAGSDATDGIETDDAGTTGGPDAAEGSNAAEDQQEAADDDNGSTGFGRKAKSLVKGKFVIEEDDLEGPLQELELALLSSDVEMGVAEEILDNIREELIGETRTFTTSTGAVVEEALRDAIYDVISVGQFDFDERIAVEDKPVTIVFTGVNGVGKTTSIAKLSRYFEERGYSTVMANGDTYRAGANEQIQEHADALGTKLISHEQGGDPAAVLYDAVEYAEANDVDVVLGDTAGRLHTDEGLMDQLEKIDRVVGPDMTLFVDEAVAGQDAVNRAREFDDAAEIDGAILTKADADSNGGAAISVAHVTGKPILFLGVGQGYDHLERFDPDEMVDRLLEDDAS
ncbi:signal recognition particle-docking protein FtsY [Natrarchaeobius chitinivorans]|uniref:Signal recognition particle receptor FtsY n=1 Tax=Natrarchaeobius chitinivorans TaxID=1679083 RepID=A0A3N6MG10_NATCH|nr:signal recognition particle-docking protein FtsY [Natrarchaeobius chitinivorans]RQG94541.1 signal recognition particle-docking protein FtsY [Natrarchaeobius chitinivorans]